MCLPPERLTERQAEILELLRQGLERQEIATRLYISLSTVRWHIEQILCRSGSNNVCHALAFYYDSTLQPEYAPRPRKKTPCDNESI